MRSTIAIRVAARAIGIALALTLTGSAATAGDAIDRMLSATRLAGSTGLPTESTLRGMCQNDARCAATRVAAALGTDARLERVHHPDTDVIRWVRTRPSVVVHPRGDGGEHIEIRRFGRKVLPELRARLAGMPESAGLTLDLRRNRGGDFERMLDVAGHLLGTIPEAFRIHARYGTAWHELDGAGRLGPRVERVLIGATTASSAEILAALLAAHGGTRLCGGERTAGKDILQRVVPVNHDWRLLVAHARIEVPGIDLAGGLAPDPTC